MVKIIRPSVLLVRDGKILVVRSKYSSGEFYLLPGGAIEGEETLIETAIREVKEETNYDVEIIKLLYLKEWINKERNKNVLDIIFLGKIVGGKETHLNDVSNHILSLDWMSVKELKREKFFPLNLLNILENDLKADFKNCGKYLKRDVC